MEERISGLFRDTTDLMVLGHEAWLELGGSHGHAGEKMPVNLKWGHNMKPDGLARKDGMKAFVVHPNGSKEGIQVTDGGPENYVLNFLPREDGLYQVIANINGNYVKNKEGKTLRGTRREYPDAEKAVCYSQFAQSIVPVGHDLEGTVPKADLQLEIQPEMLKHWRLGDEINFKIFFRDQPLDGVAVDIVCNGPGGYQQFQEITGGDGRLTFQGKEPGRYLLVARYKLQEGEEGVYDELSLTATFAFMITK